MPFPDATPLPMNTQRQLCPRCQRSGNIVPCDVTLGRKMEENHGYLWFTCPKCGWISETMYVPLSFLSAQSPESLRDEVGSLGLHAIPVNMGELSPGAREVVDEFSLNPYLLAEACAKLAALASERAAELDRLRDGG